MKTITKILATSAAVVALFFTTTNANAQSKLGVGITAGIPTSDAYSVALGADLRYQFDVDKQLSIPVTAGYTNLSVKDKFGGGSFGYIPVKAGVKYFFNPSGAGVYGLAELGAGFGTKSGSGTSFVYSPAVGYAWSNGLDLGVKYEGLSQNGGSTGFFGLRLAYGFSL
ncbi:outer membrane beta-barrel protein [Pedobacter nototheniae]|uniref:outer membrane beta-barrel protein n=1 Tax=Pedobacter nototheniae TaxID=2488994 RepID=UPI00292F9677|nr:outer membrane beta-barrel protein [Pedobacter nototheniae]